MTSEESRTAAERLMAIHKNVTEKRAEEAAKATADQARETRRSKLFEDAQQSFATIFALLRQRVAAVGLSADISRAQGLTIRLGSGALQVDPVERAPSDSLAAYDYAPTFDVIAYSAIEARKPRDPYDYEGRSHSLWFSDAHDPEVYRWFELAFMVQPIVAQRFTLDPFSLPPTDKDAANALTQVVTVRQVAWPPIPFDQGEEEQFIDRWIGWLVDASMGTLSHPRSMPETTEGKWRTAQR